MADEKAKAMSIKSPMDAIGSARIISASRGRTMTDLMDEIPRPALAEKEGKARATGRTDLDRSNLMSTVTPTGPASTAATLPTAPVLYRMTVDEYERIGEILGDPRVELIDGHLVKKTPKNPEHSWSTKQVFNRSDRRRRHAALAAEHSLRPGAWPERGGRRRSATWGACTRPPFLLLAGGRVQTAKRTVQSQ